MTQSLRQAIDAIRLIDQRAYPGLAGFFEDFPPEKRVLKAMDHYRTPEEACAGFPYLREAYYEAYEKIYGFGRDATHDSSRKNDMIREYDCLRNNLKALVDKAMDAAGVDILMANSFHHHDLKNKSRIRLIASMDPFIFPFDNTYLTTQGPLASSYLAAFEHILRINQVKNRHTLSDYQGYLALVDATLEGFANNHVSGIEFLFSIARTNFTEKVSQAQGALLFEKARRGDWAAYRKLQDLLIRYILKKCASYALPVQWRCTLSDSHVDHFDCLHLSDIIHDTEIGNAVIIITEGNWPKFDHAEMLALAGGLLPNRVYIDISGQMMLKSHPRILAATLRTWLEKPILWDKILYGSGYQSGERDLFVAAKTARDAVYLALSGMMNDGILDENTAVTIASKVLRENAQRVYNLSKAQA
ncbi:MAG: hypothetical protein R6W75_13795 [Smithellaceae bacterium]